MGDRTAVQEAAARSAVARSVAARSAVARSAVSRAAMGPAVAGRVVAGLAVAALAAVAVVLPAAPAAADTGPWDWPLAGRTEVSRAFAPPEHRYGSGHRGVDLPGTPGEPVLAAGAGRVSWAGPIAGRGVVVVVHGALRTTYEPVEAAVEVGRLVGLGEPLGRLAPGHAGCPVPACLHWGLRRGEPYLDPLRLLGAGPVRLLPLAAPVGGTAARHPATGGTTVDGTAADGPAAPEGPVGAVPVGAAIGTAAVGTASDGVTSDGVTSDGAAGAGPAPPTRGPGAAGEPHQGPAPAVGSGTWWSLRAADAPAGGVALAALLAGLALIAGPRRPPHGPAATERPAPPPTEAHPDLPPVLPVDLAVERTRRRTAA